MRLRKFIHIIAYVILYLIYNLTEISVKCINLTKLRSYFIK